MSSLSGAKNLLRSIHGEKQRRRSARDDSGELARPRLAT